MMDMLAPVLKQSLTEDLTQRIRGLIQTNGYEAGDRLPSITEMARRFQVGPPTLREALKKLEALGLLDIRHGSGVYVGKNPGALLVSNPVFVGSVSKKLVVDLIEARIPIEVKAAALAAEHATAHHLETMRDLLATADRNLDNDEVLTSTNMAFHRHISLASGNTVLAQLLEVLSNLFQQEQRLILNIFGSRKKDHVEHVGILDALLRHDTELASTRMEAHLEGVRRVLLQWEPRDNPVD